MYPGGLRQIGRTPPSRLLQGQSVKFRFEPLRATQASAVLIRLAGGRLNYTKLLKLLYLADRQSLVETGSPITGDTVVNMDNGPVLSAVYDCIKERPRSFSVWQEYFRKAGYDVELTADPGDGELSDYDVDVLNQQYQKHQAADYSEMIDFVHDLPEWEDPSPNKSAPLSYEEILRAADVPQETIREYESLNDSLQSIDRIRIVRGDERPAR